MYNKKGVAIPVLGTVFIIISIIAFAILGTVGGEFLRSSTEKAGKTISLVNFAESIRKMTNESLDIIARRTAYDLGKLGGIKGTDTTIWTVNYPKIEDLKTILENEIKQRLPHSDITDDRKITWENNSINIDIIYSLDPVIYSTSFLAGGFTNFSVYDQSIDSKIKVNHVFNHPVNSSYFKLLHIGRQIFEDAAYYSLLTTDTAMLETSLKTDFNIEASIKDSGDYWNISLKDVNCLLTNEFYCIAPLRADEPKLVIWKGENIPYDYLQLNFRIKKV